MKHKFMTNKKDKKFTFIDLFAGIGGIRIAFERNGGECVFTSEFDEPCQISYEANFGEKKIFYLFCCS